jgi:hypothetical protein
VKELEVREVLKLIGAAYPTQRQRMSNDDVRAMAAVYTAGLLDLDFGRVRAAVDRLVKSSKWIPTIAEIREAAVDVAHGTRVPGGEAWGKCLAMIRRYGSHRHPGADFPVDDPILLATISSFSWRDLCHGDNAAADRARFIELYDQLAKGERKEAAIAPNATSKALPSPHRTEEPRAMRELVHGLLPTGESR